MLNAAGRGIREGRSAAGNGFAAPARSGGVLGRGGAGQTVEFVKDPTRAANDGEGRIFGRVDGEAGPLRNGVREARQERSGRRSCYGILQPVHVPMGLFAQKHGQ